MSDARELRRAVLKDGVLWLALSVLVAASVAAETVRTYASCRSRSSARSSCSCVLHGR